jgi:hypothetical protein
MKAAERRRFCRVAVSAPVDIEWGSETLQAKTGDVSLCGMFVQTDDPLWLHARFAARIRTADPIPVDCIVRRVVPGRGMGVEFESLAEPVRAQLEKLIDQSDGA